MSDLIRLTKAADVKKRGGALGTGIAKHIVQLRRGQVWVERTLEKRPSFFFTLAQRPS
jgi:signal transduction histidine kinase